MIRSVQLVSTKKLRVVTILFPQMLGYNHQDWGIKDSSPLGDLILHTTSPTDYTNKQHKEKLQRTVTKKKKDCGSGEKPYYCPITGCIRSVLEIRKNLFNNPELPIYFPLRFVTTEKFTTYLIPGDSVEVMS